MSHRVNKQELMPKNYKSFYKKPSIGSFQIIPGVTEGDFYGILMAFRNMVTEFYYEFGTLVLF